MIIACPNCSAVYELPGHLLGPGGAAVRCPHCAGEFTLGADGGVIAAAGAGVGAARATGMARAPEPGTGGTRAAAAARAPEVATVTGAARAAAAEPDERAEPGSDARAIARRVLDELSARNGTAMADANARGRLLSEFGPDLAQAFEEFRKESGRTGNAAPFREALRERWGIDLSPPARGA